MDMMVRNREWERDRSSDGEREDRERQMEGDLVKERE